MIEFGEEICANFSESSTLEWLETNGIGGFASSTVSGANTRRYHGILTAALRPPLGRVTTLSKFEETVIIDGEKFEISSNQYPNSIYPEGFKFLKSFRLAPFPVWTYEIGNVRIEKKNFMVYGENTTVCRWKIKGENENVKLELRPLFSFVDYHALQHETRNVEFEKDEFSENLIFIKPSDDAAEIYLAHNAAELENTGFWYKDFEYAIEKERGFDFHEDLFQPFILKFDLSEKEAIVFASTEKHDVSFADNLENVEILRREKLIETANAKDDFTKQLVLAADQFIVSRGDGKTIIAGYPWFSDWGRDTMIALPGLTLATNRAEIARDILLEFSKYISEGMIPNRFPDVGENAEYNTVDATLWYFEAIRAYAENTGDFNFVKEHLYEKLKDIIEWHFKGTRYNIHVDQNDGLLVAGTQNSQLTWMDAKDGDTVFTPRSGKAVEIQALWFNALNILADFAEKFGEREIEEKYASSAEKARQSFDELFWNDAKNCLFDVIEEDGMPNGQLRPNQIFAVSLHYSMLNIEKARKIVETVENNLLTPVGLRSLAPDDSQYQGIYEGSPFKRDSSYHQGTVWAWLIGGFIDALRKTSENSAQTERKIEGILDNFSKHLCEAGMGQISEIFDGDAPHKPRGCFAQAWSVSEILRVTKEQQI